MTKKTEKRERAVFVEFELLIENGQWSDARNIIAKEIDADNDKFARRLNDYYQENLCDVCMGTGKVVESGTSPDNNVYKKCICQIEQ